MLKLSLVKIQVDARFEIAPRKMFRVERDVVERKSIFIGGKCMYRVREIPPDVDYHNFE